MDTRRACCCNDGGSTIPQDCDDFPSSVLVSWAGALEVTYSPCVCGTAFELHPLGSASLPTSSSHVSTLDYPDPSFPDECDYVGTNTVTSGPFHVDEINCFLGDVDDASITPQVHVSAPYRFLGFWMVTVDLDVASLTSPGNVFNSCNSTCTTDMHHGFCSVVDFIGPPATSSPVGSYVATRTTFQGTTPAPGYLTIIADSTGTVTVT